MKYPNIRLGDVEAVWNKLGGEEGVQQFLRGGLIVSKPQVNFKTWRTVKLGTGLKTALDFRQALKNADCKIGNWGNDILGKPPFEQSVADKETEVELVNVSVAELGFKDGATRADIYKRAQELGLDICPAEVGPQLRLQYTDQPKGEVVLIAMEPITDSGSSPNVFEVRRNDDGEQCLYADYGRPVRFWNGSSRWVFIRRK
jgi:hypothetical protein